MLQAMFSGVSGLQAEQTGLDVIGNNIANVNTTGFKSGVATFETQLSQTLKSAAAPNGNQGGTDPSQVGLGVVVGAISVLQTQGNLQATGSNTDLALQGSGFFMVGSGSTVSYTRDGSFTLDGSGNLVNSATGQELLGYPADSTGKIDTTQQVTTSSNLKIPLGILTSVKQTTQASFQGNLDAGSSIQSTYTTLDGNLANNPTTINTTAYDAQGNAHQVSYTFTQGSPTATDNIWNVGITVDSIPVTGTHTMAFNLTSGAYDAANSSGLPSTLSITGQNGAPNFSLNVNYASTLSDISTNAATAHATTDGQSGSLPTWSTSINVYDSLGVKHNLVVNFQRTLVGADTGKGNPPLAAPPASATAQWDWTVSENGVVLSSSTPGVVNPPGTSLSTGSNSPLYFNTNGQLIDTSKQTAVVTPTSGAGDPFSVAIDFSGISQLAGTPSVAANGQDGYPLGTLQSFSIDPTGLITGVFSNGQSQSLGQIATATFSQPSGLSASGNNDYTPTANSGQPQIGLPGQSGRGTISTGFLEMSNVDLSTQFTNMIVTQRGFEANTRIVTTVNTMLQDVLNLIP